LDDDDFEEAKPKKTPVVRKPTPAPAVKKESEVAKTAIKQEPVNNFFGKSSAASEETPVASSSVQKKQQSIVDMMKSKPAAKPIPVKEEAMSEDEAPAKTGKRGNGRSRKIVSDDDDDDEGDDDDVEMEDVEVAPRAPSSRARAARAKRPVIVDDESEFEDEDEDDFLPASPRKMTKSLQADSKAASKKTAGTTPKARAGAEPSAAKTAVKKMFSLSNDDGEDMDEEVEEGKEDKEDRVSGPDESGSDRESGSGRSSMSRTAMPPAIVDEDDDSMFSITAPSKVSQVKKRSVLQSRVPKSGSASSGGGGSGLESSLSGSGGGTSFVTEVCLPMSFSTSVTSTGAVAGAKTLNAGSSGPAKAPKAVASSLLADLEDVSNIVSRPKMGRTTSKRPVYVDISDEE